MAGEAAESSSQLNLVIKNPGRDAKSDFRLDVEAATSLGQVKQRLQREYIGNPAPEAQTVRPCLDFHGCVLTTAKGELLALRDL